MPFDACDNNSNVEAGVSGDLEGAGYPTVGNDGTLGRTSPHFVHMREELDEGATVQPAPGIGASSPRGFLDDASQLLGEERQLRRRGQGLLRARLAVACGQRDVPDG